jgi:nitrogen regulatory protein P-II 1
MQSETSLKKVEAVVRKEKFPDIDNALKEAGIGGLTFFDVEGRGRAKGMEMISGRGAATYTREYAERTKLEIIVKESKVKEVVDAILKAAKTGQLGDGKILVLPVEEAWDITTGSSDSSAV